MSFIAPALVPHLYGRYHFGACLVGAHIADPGGAPGKGIVHLRGAVSGDPLFAIPPLPPSGLFTIFTLPAGMRPIADRWFLCVVSKYLGLFDATPHRCVVRPGGQVDVESVGGPDGAVFFDGISFIAEQ